MRRTDKAWVAALTSDDVARRLLVVNAGQLADRHAFSLSGQWNEASPLLARLAAGGEVDATVAWDRAQRWGNSWDRERELRRSPRVSEEKDVVRAHERWVVAEREYGRSIVERMRNGPDDPGAAVSEARTRAERAEADYRAAARLAGVAVPTIEPALADILAGLGADETLLRFAIASNAPDKSEAIVAYVARGRMPVSVVELAPASATFAALDSWRAVLSDSPRARAGAEDECRRAGAAVRSLLWEPLARWVETATIVHVVDASLGGVPWQALPIGESLYLVERGPEVRVHESEAELLRPDPAGLEVRVLAIGNPDFDHSPGSEILLADAGPSDARRGGLETCTPFPQLARLPASELEADEVARTLSRDSIVRTGAEADEERFKREAPGATVIHLATHGVVLADTCAVAGASGYRGVGGLVPLAAPSSAPSTSSASTTRSTRLPEDAATTLSPWLGRRISLAFAGANHARHAEDENDGLLSAEEIATLDLRDADWVVLSACHAGANESWTAEGALGMTRALHLAGARTVIASRWSLEDESTLEFMRELYQARERGVRQGNAALHEACRAVLASRRQGGRTTHPFYWASFTASGD
jgi:CHAT domain-containing protein